MNKLKIKFPKINNIEVKSSNVIDNKGDLLNMLNLDSELYLKNYYEGIF